MPLFFTLSGFVIHYRYGRDFVEKKLVTGLAGFFGARFARLAPLYFFFLFVYLYMGGLFTALLRGDEYSAFLLLNFTPSFSWLPIWYHGRLQAEIFYQVSWSISTEIFFYACYPFFASLLWKIRSVKLLLTVATIFCVAVLTWLWWISHSSAWDDWASTVFPGYVSAPEDFGSSFYRWFVYISPYTRIFEFISGTMAAQYFLIMRGRSLGRIEHNVGYVVTLLALGTILALFGLLMCAFAGKCADPFIAFLHMNFLFPIPIAVLMVSTARYRTPVSVFLSGAVCVYLGEISYSLYLSHPLAGMLVDKVSSASNEWFPYATALMKVALTIAIAACTYKLVELPSRKWLRKRLARLVGHPEKAKFVVFSCLVPVAMAGILMSINYSTLIAESKAAAAAGPAVPGNLLWPSENLKNSNWVLDGAQIVAGAPKPPAIADAIVETNGSGFHRIMMSVNGVVPRKPYTFSVYAKNDGRSVLMIEIRDSANKYYGVAVYNLTASKMIGYYGDVINSGVGPAGNGWVRCWIVTKFETGQADIALDAVSAEGMHIYPGDGKSGLLLWGAQLGAGGEPGTYVATTTGPVAP